MYPVAQVHWNSALKDLLRGWEINIEWLHRWQDSRLAGQFMAIEIEMALEVFQE